MQYREFLKKEQIEMSKDSAATMQVEVTSNSVC